jgi:phage shock protein A
VPSLADKRRDRLAREVAAISEQLNELTRETRSAIAAASVAIDSLTEQLDELDRRLTNVHEEALRALTRLITPKGGA